MVTFMSQLELEKLFDSLQTTKNIPAKVETNDPAAVRRQTAEVALRLRRLQHPKGVRLAGYLQILVIVSRQMKKDAGVGSAFMQLPRGVQNRGP
jgi:hypothetical protein